MLNFLGIGGIRCGTSWTHLRLREHPELWLPEVKELQFWSWANNLGDDAVLDHLVVVYKAVFEERGPRVCGEVSPSYSAASLDVKMIKNIREINKELKIFLILRDPIERAFSQMKLQMFVREGLSSSEYLIKKSEGFAALDADRFLMHLNETVSWGDYHTIYQKWAAIFSPEQILVLQFEDIAEDPAHFLGQIASFLNVDPTFWRKNEAAAAHLREKRNYIENVEMPLVVRQALFERYYDKVIEISKFFGLDANAWLKKHLDILGKYAKGSTMNRRRRFQAVKAEPNEMNELKSALANQAAVALIHLTPEQAAATPFEVQEALWNQGVLGIYQHNEGLDCSDVQGAIKHFRALVGGPETQLHVYADNLYRFMKFQAHVELSPVQLYSLTYQYMKQFYNRCGRWPTKVLDIGLWRDHLGQALCCANLGVRFSGVSLKSRLPLSRGGLLSVFQSLGLEVPNPDGACDEVLFDAKPTDLQGQPSFELIFSHDTLEHVSDPETFVKGIFDVTAPSGYFIAHLDLSCHGYGDDPWAFLLLSDEEFAEKAGKDINIGNRLRHDDWWHLLARAGYKITSSIDGVLEVPENVKAAYPGRELSASSVCLACRKEAKKSESQP